MRYKFNISLNDDSAIVTHYLQNAGTKYALPFKNDALLLLNGTDDEDKQGYVAEPNPQYNLFPELLSVPFPGPKKAKFTFIDLFAGIGGFRITQLSINVDACSFCVGSDCDVMPHVLAQPRM